MGGAFRKGVNLSKAKNVIFIPTDDSHPIKGLCTIFKKFKNMDKNKILISYVQNKKARNLSRRIISASYTKILNIIFLTNIKYFNGLNIYPLKKLKNNLNMTNSFSFQTEILIMMIKKGVNYDYVKTFISERKIGETNAFKIKNIFLVIKSIFKLIFRYYAK